MKKILLATTAIIVTNAVANADVNFEGDARLGLVHNGADDILKVEKRLRININASAEADFFDLGGHIRLNSDEGGGVSTAGGGSVYLKTDAMRVTVGNTNGAANRRIATFAGDVGLTGLNWRNVIFNIGSKNWDLNSQSSGGDAGDVVRLDFDLGDLGVSLSVDQTTDLDADGTETSLALNYTIGDWKLGAGFVGNINNGTAANGVGTFTSGAGATVTTVTVDTATKAITYSNSDGSAVPYTGARARIAAATTTDAVDVAVSKAGTTGVTENDAVFASIGGPIGGLEVGIGYGEVDEVGYKVTLHASAVINRTTVTAFVASTSQNQDAVLAPVTFVNTVPTVYNRLEDSAGIGPRGSKTEYGIGFSHDLGGAKLKGGIVSDYNKDTHADLGVSFSF